MSAEALFKEKKPREKIGLYQSNTRKNNRVFFGLNYQIKCILSSYKTS